MNDCSYIISLPFSRYRCNLPNSIYTNRPALLNGKRDECDSCLLSPMFSS